MCAMGTAQQAKESRPSSGGVASLASAIGDVVKLSSSGNQRVPLEIRKSYATNKYKIDRRGQNIYLSSYYYYKPAFLVFSKILGRLELLNDPER